MFGHWTLRHRPYIRIDDTLFMSISKIFQYKSQLAYLCGFIAGDGSLSYRSSKNEYSLKCVGNPRDEQEYYDIVVVELFRNLFDLTPTTKHFDKRTTYGFRIFSKHLFNYLVSLELSVSPKYATLHIPSWIYEQSLLAAFIRGIFDTDGCLCFKKRYREKPYYPVLSLSSKSSDFCKELYSALRIMGFSPVLCSFKSKASNGSLTTISRVELNGFTQLQLWMNLIGTWHPKNKNKIAGGGFEFGSAPSWEALPPTSGL